MRLSHSEHPPDLAHTPPAWVQFLIDHVISLHAKVGAIEAYLHEGDRRMDRIETHAQQIASSKPQPAAKTATAEIIGFMREVGSPREWVAWAILTAMWLKGAILAPDVHALVFKALTKATGG